jgi:hypothetical protein
MYPYPTPLDAKIKKPEIMGKFFRKLWVIKTDDCERNDPSSQTSLMPFTPSNGVMFVKL